MLDKTKYHALEHRFSRQVKRDREHAMEVVTQSGGIYLPCREPISQVEYIIVGMEPSFNWADSIEDAEKKIAGGFRNFDSPKDAKHRLALFRRSIERYLLRPDETYHLTDLSKGAMPTVVANLDRERRWEEWYPLLLEEIEIVGKPGASVIAIGTKVQQFLLKRGLSKKTARPLYSVPHYSTQASRYITEEAESTPGFERFRQAELGANGGWLADLSEPCQRLLFVYKKRFEEIHAHMQQNSG